jgi:Family of unknown function (DUF6328)
MNELKDRSTARSETARHRCGSHRRTSPGSKSFALVDTVTTSAAAASAAVSSPSLHFTLVVLASRPGSSEPRVRSPATGNGDLMAEAEKESQAERLDRELIELLNELRVLLPGVQVLFAFLLTAPFASGFEDVTDFQRDLYGVCLLTALAASGCLVAPTTYHRVQWRQRDKEVMLRTANTLALLGSVFLAASMTCSILLVGDYLFDRWVALLASAAAGVFLALLWFVLPLTRRATDD